MIEVIKILEGGIDLRTGNEEPRSLVLAHNGVTATMPVSTEQLQVILQLLGAGDHPNVEQPLPPSAPTPSMPTVPENGHARAPVDAGASYVEDSLPVGETYSDPETGVGAY